MTTTILSNPNARRRRNLFSFSFSSTTRRAPSLRVEDAHVETDSSFFLSFFVRKRKKRASFEECERAIQRPKSPPMSKPKNTYTLNRWTLSGSVFFSFFLRHLEKRKRGRERGKRERERKREEREEERKSMVDFQSKSWKPSRSSRSPPRRSSVLHSGTRFKMPTIATSSRHSGLVRRHASQLAVFVEASDRVARDGRRASVEAAVGGGGRGGRGGRGGGRVIGRNDSFEGSYRKEGGGDYRLVVFYLLLLYYYHDRQIARHTPAVVSRAAAHFDPFPEPIVTASRVRTRCVEISSKTTMTMRSTTRRPLTRRRLRLFRDVFADVI